MPREARPASCAPRRRARIGQRSSSRAHGVEVKTGRLLESGQGIVLTMALARSVWKAARWLPLLGLAAVAWLAFAGRAEGGPGDDDGAPPGAIAFFTGG